MSTRIHSTLFPDTSRLALQNANSCTLGVRPGAPSAVAPPAPIIPLTCALVDVVSPATDAVIRPLSVRLKQTREFASLDQPHRIAAPHDASTKPGKANSSCSRRRNLTPTTFPLFPYLPFRYPFLASCLQTRGKTQASELRLLSGAPKTVVLGFRTIAAGWSVEAANVGDP